MKYIEISPLLLVSIHFNPHVSKLNHIKSPFLLLKCPCSMAKSPVVLRKSAHVSQPLVGSAGPRRNATGGVGVGMLRLSNAMPRVAHVRGAVLLRVHLRSARHSAFRKTRWIRWVGYPNGWYIMEHPFTMDDLGVASFKETSKWWLNVVWTSKMVV